MAVKLVWRAYRVYRISAKVGHTSAALRPAAVYLVRSNIIEAAIQFSVGAVVLYIVDRNAEPGDLGRRFGLRTADEAASAISRATDDVKGFRKLEDLERIPRLLAKTIGQTGVTPFLPFVGSEIFYKVLEKQGVPRWIIGIGRVIELI